MLRGKRRTESQRHTLFVVIGTWRIECGVMRGAASHASWVTGSGIDIPIGTGGFASSLPMLASGVRDLQVKLSVPAFHEMRVLVADHWLAVAGVPWSPSAQRPASAIPYARTQLAAAGFTVESADTLKLDDAPFGAPRLAAAYPGALLTALRQLAQSLKARLTSILPLSVAAWALAQHRENSRPPAVGILDVGLVILARSATSGRSRLSEVTVRTSESEHAPTEQDLSATWRRLCFREPQLLCVKHVALLDLTAPDGAANAVSSPFVRLDPPSRDAMSASRGLLLAASAGSLRSPLDAQADSPPLTRGHWMALGAAALLTGGMILQAGVASLSVSSLATRLATPVDAPTSAFRPVTWGREELPRVQAVNTAIRELNFPIKALLHALEPPKDVRVAVLSFETTGSASGAQASSAKIVAEAPSGAEMARYVAYLAERKPFTGAYLTRHEIIDAAAHRSYRFTVEALWSE